MMETFMDMDRDEVLQMLQWADPNGIWTDARSEGEGFPPMTWAEASEQVLSWSKEDSEFNLDSLITRFRQGLRADA